MEYFREFPTYFSRVDGVNTAEAMKDLSVVSEFLKVHLARGTTGLVDSESEAICKESQDVSKLEVVSFSPPSVDDSTS